MLEKYGTSVALYLLFLSLLAFAFLARKPICIDSRVVQRIDRVEDSVVASAIRCSFHKSLGFDKDLFEVIPVLNKKINSVEVFLESILPFHKPIHISLFQNESLYFKQSGHTLQISTDLLGSMALEKGIIKIWLSEQNIQLIDDQDLLAEIFSDFILHLAGFELPKNEVQDWPFVLKNFRQYCKSDWKIYEHFKICKGTIDSQDLVSLSVRPFISQSLIAAYSNLQLKERKQLINELPTILKSIAYTDSEYGISATDSSSQSFLDISFKLSQSVRALTSLKGSEVYNEFIGHLENEISKRGFENHFGFSKVKNLVIYEDYLSPMTLSHLIGLKESESTAVQSKGELYLLPSAEPFFEGSIGKLKSDKLVYITCSWPKYSEISALQEVSSKVTLVKDCKQKANIKYLLSGNLEKFAANNPDIEFIEVHLPSFVYALKKSKINLHRQLALADELFRKAIGWRQPVENQNLSFYTSNTDIEAVQRFRVKN